MRGGDKWTIRAFKSGLKSWFNESAQVHNGWWVTYAIIGHLLFVMGDGPDGYISQILFAFPKIKN